MAKSKLTTCKACGAEIAKSAKSCPHCGAKNKKPIYKKWWFWVIILILVNTIGNSGKRANHKPVSNNGVQTVQSVPVVKEQRTVETVAQETVKAEPEVTQATETIPVETTVPASSSGINPDFKAAMDAYESFYTEYCQLLKKYMANPTDFTILAKYADMMSRVEQMDQAFEAWNEDDMNSEELKYYLDVNNRVLKMMADMMG